MGFFKFWSKLFQTMWKINSKVSTTKSIMNGTYHKRLVRKAKFRAYNKWFK